jgi:hypothetical protein
MTNLALLQAAREALDVADDFLRRNLERHLTLTDPTPSMEQPFDAYTVRRSEA